ncbi:MAG: preprotein translocase subunit SecA [Puniceicoccales bacterium]|jgi:preprotein translocase subunit SecA|nr:preprotein translocase subunit SecA [Puniceicoccales bacterium]
MIGRIFRLFSGRHYRKFLKKCQPIVKAIYRFDEQYNALADGQLCEKTMEFMQRHRDGESLDSLLPEAFALVKNAARRLCGQKVEVCGHELEWNMIHYDVQLIGGIALHQRMIAEMATGEGKTLVATLPLYLNALTGRNCQLATVNDYLAKRDSEWMSYLYNLLGISVGCLQNDMDSDDRKQEYDRNITYGTSSEFGFDYLRDNGIATYHEDQVQKDHYFCIVDEIDSILIDEARTPLIISGPTREKRKTPFMELKPAIEKLVSVQKSLCNKLAEEASKLLAEDQFNMEAYKKLWQIKQGMPKNRQLLRMMETGVYRKQLDKFDLEMGADINRELRVKMKEDLYFAIDERNHQADLSEIGRNTLFPSDPDAFVLPDLPALFSIIDGNKDMDPAEKEKIKREAEEDFAIKSEKLHCVSQLLRAYSLYSIDEEYVIQDGKVVIVDENTGRAMPGRRWSDGLHQAIEAKEGLRIEKESKTYATITIQNYFRMYEKLAGMTGTAETEAQEFFDIYKLSVMAIPTNCPCLRKDFNDLIFKTRREKYNAVVERIKEANQNHQPVLVGTASVEASELLSRMLKSAKIKHTVLNAKFHQKEAEIIANAGMRDAVTISTNMAGRGTDIKLGDGIAELGGLLVIGTERHESRRVDRQLRGRCARQGDPGMSVFYASLEDNLIRLFAGSGPIANILERTFKEGEVLEHPWLNSSIERAQKKVEASNYSMRRRLLQYDDVLNKQREIVYALRNKVLNNSDIREMILDFINEEIFDRAQRVIGRQKAGLIDEGELDSFIYHMNMSFPISLNRQELLQLNSADGLGAFSFERVKDAYNVKISTEDEDILPEIERSVILNSIDVNWQDHLTEMEELRRSVSMAGYGQKDPLAEYKQEAYHCFEQLISQIREGVCNRIFRASTSINTFKDMLLKLSKVGSLQIEMEEKEEKKEKREKKHSNSNAGGRNKKIKPSFN